MGYRSDVAYMIEFRKPEDYWGFIAEAQSDPDTMMCWDKEEWNSFKQNDEQLCIQFSADCVKWYPEYPDVMCHINLWDKARQRDADTLETCDGYYVRIGEEVNDLDEKSFGMNPPYDWIEINRSIQINWGN